MTSVPDQVPAGSSPPESPESPEPPAPAGSPETDDSREVEPLSPAVVAADPEDASGEDLTTRPEPGGETTGPAVVAAADAEPVAGEPTPIAEAAEAAVVGDDPDPAPAEEVEPPRARRIGTDTDEGREEAVSAASAAVQRGELVVLPTDTVYGIGADAFDAQAVQALLDAKGRGREMPPPVLISSVTTLDALAVSVTDYARALVDRFWPGPLTIICNQQPSLQWDLGETRGTVAIRMPHHALAIELLERTGPMAVSSANLTGHPAATDADQAEEMLGEAVAVIIDDGPSPGGSASTIVDVRGAKGKVLRHGAISLEELNEALEGLEATIEDAE